MEHIAAVDLHSDNGYYGIIEPDGKWGYQKRLPNDLTKVLKEPKVNIIDVPGFIDNVIDR